MVAFVWTLSACVCHLLVQRRTLNFLIAVFHVSLTNKCECFLIQRELFGVALWRFVCSLCGRNWIVTNIEPVLWRIRGSPVVDSSWNVMAHGDAREGKWRGKLANAVGSQYSSHYLGTRCIQHYYRWRRTPRAASSRLNWRPPPGRFKWTRSFRAKDEIWFLRVCHHISTGLYHFHLFLAPQASVDDEIWVLAIGRNFYALVYLVVVSEENFMRYIEDLPKNWSASHRYVEGCRLHTFWRYPRRITSVILNWLSPLEFPVCSLRLALVPSHQITVRYSALRQQKYGLNML